MSERANVDKQFALSLVALIVLTAGGIVLGALLQTDRLGLILVAAVAVLLVLAAVAYLAAYRPLLVLVSRERELDELATTDALTGLFNRSAVLERLQCEINRAWRGGEPLACALVDIDHFRRINDQFGPVAGESVLRALGNVIAESCREYDVAGRYGGEQFLVILPATELDDAARVADRLRRRIEANEFACHGEGFTVTVSIGVTQADVDTPKEVDELIRRAGEALSRAKAEGRNRVSAQTTLAAVEHAATPAPTPPPR